ALKRLGVEALLSNNPTKILTADKIIFPGVGEANSAMNMLKKRGVDVLIPQLKQPVLGICLGMQLLCNHTEEGNTKGLGIFDVSIKRSSNLVKVQEVDWNNITNLKSKVCNGISENKYMNLVHSDYAENCKEAIALSAYSLVYTSALQKNNL